MDMVAHVGMLVAGDHADTRDGVVDADVERFDEGVEARRIAELPALPAGLGGVVLVEEEGSVCHEGAIAGPPTLVIPAKARNPAPTGLAAAKPRRSGSALPTCRPCSPVSPAASLLACRLHRTRSTSIFLISAIALAGFNPLGHTLAQFMIV